MYWWQRFDPLEVRSDFSRIRAAGFDTVRIFLLWEDFQPSPTSISRKALTDLVFVADTAASEPLSLIVTLFTGHMSGVNWIPHWALESKSNASEERFRIVADGRVIRARPRNWYHDEEILTAQSQLAREVAGTLHDHPALWAWDLGNENSNCLVPPTSESGSKWLRRITTEIRSQDSRPITIGLHMEDLEEDRRIGPKEAGTVTDFLCMHGYPIYTSLSRSSEDELLLPFLGMVTQWLSGQDVLFEEFGAPTIPSDAKNAREARDSRFTFLTEGQAASYTFNALNALSSFGFLGAFLWCYADYAEALWQEPPLDQALHERYFGLWRSDGSPKPAVRAIKQFSERMPDKIKSDLSWVDMVPEEFYLAPKENLRRLYQKFLKSEWPSSAIRNRS